MLQDAINFELLKELADIEDYELIAGAGTGTHLKGLTVAATAYSYSGSTTGDTKIDTLSHYMLQLEKLERYATGVILNPEDWRIITTTKTNDPSIGSGVYVLGGPGGPIAQTLWGIPVAITTAMPAGKALV